jgi:hypothetical protein
MHTEYARYCTSALLLVATVLILASSVRDAALIPFNHDESVSFSIFHWDPGARFAANHHPLNTFLMRGTSILLGNSEFALRLPNVLAHALYLLCTLLLVRRFRNPGLQITGFVLVNIHPIILNYFAVARGYGLALAFQVASLYFIFRMYENLAEDSPAADLRTGLARSRSAASGLLRPATTMAAMFAAGAALSVLFVLLFPRARLTALVLASLLLAFPALGPLARYRGPERYLYLTLAAAALSVLSNLSFLNFFLPVLGLCAWVLVSDTSRLRFRQHHPAEQMALCLATGVFFAAALIEVFKLRRAGELYIGGQTSFMHDTLDGLIRYSLFAAIYSVGTAPAISAIVVGSFAVLLVVGVKQFLGERPDRSFVAVVWILASAVALVLLQHHVLSNPFPHPRAALYYIPLYSLLIPHAADKILQRLADRNWGTVVGFSLAVTAIGAVAWTAYSGALNTVYRWAQDNHNHEVLEIIDRDRTTHAPGRAVTLHSNRVHEPSLNFYRFTRKYTWLKPVPRLKRPSGDVPASPMFGEDADYVYIYERDLDDLQVEQHVRLASYPDIGTVLLRVCSGRCDAGR